MRSIFVLEVDDGSGMVYADQRDLATHQVMALEGVQDGTGGHSVIISDVSRALPGEAPLMSGTFQHLDSETE